MKKIEPFQFITQDTGSYAHVELAEKAMQGGARWVQLRIKGASFSEWKRYARKARIMCEHYNASLIVNDNVEIACGTKADGVHLGMKDVPVKEARKVLGPDFIIGGTANTADQVRYHLDQGADYIGIGPFRLTGTKQDLAPVLGLEGIGNLARTFPDVPLIAIGGIKIEDLDELGKTGVHGIAVSSAISDSRDPAGQAGRFIEAWEKG